MRIGAVVRPLPHYTTTTTTTTLPKFYSATTLLISRHQLHHSSLSSLHIITSLPLLPHDHRQPLIRLNHSSIFQVQCGIAATTRLGGHADNDQLVASQPRLGEKWTEYQGINNWEGLLHPLHPHLRSEILRYGALVEATYRAFDFDPCSPTYATCKFPKTSLLSQSGLGDHTGYRVTKNLRATCGLQYQLLPRWIHRPPPPSSWIGYVAVCQDKAEICRLGRRDVVVAFRGTATLMEWFQNLRATLTTLPPHHHHHHVKHYSASAAPPMVESGFLSLYTSSSDTCPSLQSMLREEIARILQVYGGDDDVPLSLTFTGHSLGAALATLTAYDITSTFRNPPMVTVLSFGGPRVGNKSFRCQLEAGGTKILRIVNSDDVITKVPGFLVDDSRTSTSSRSSFDDDRKRVAVHGSGRMGRVACWLQRRVEDALLGYAEVGQELRLSSKDSPHLIATKDVATCHDLSTYLALVSGGLANSTACPVFRARARSASASASNVVF